MSSFQNISLYNFVTFYLYPLALAKAIALVCLYLLDITIQVNLRKNTYLAFGIFQILHPLDIGNFLQQIC